MAALERNESLKLDLTAPTIPTPELREAYERTRLSSAPDNWMVVEVQRNGMFLDGEGVGGIAEMRKRFQDKETLFGYLKCMRPNDQAAFVLVAYMSAKAPSMVKAKGAVAAQFATSVFEHNLFINITSVDELNELSLEKLLKGLGGVSPSVASSPIRNVFARSLMELQKKGLVTDGGVPPVGPAPRVPLSRGNSSAAIHRGSASPGSISRGSSATSIVRQPSSGSLKRATSVSAPYSLYGGPPAAAPTASGAAAGTASPAAAMHPPAARAPSKTVAFTATNSPSANGSTAPTSVTTSPPTSATTTRKTKRLSLVPESTGGDADGAKQSSLSPRSSGAASTSPRSPKSGVKGLRSPKTVSKSHSMEGAAATVEQGAVATESTAAAAAAPAVVAPPPAATLEGIVIDTAVAVQPVETSAAPPAATDPARPPSTDSAPGLAGAAAEAGSPPAHDVPATVVLVQPPTPDTKPGDFVSLPSPPVGARAKDGPSTDAANGGKLAATYPLKKSVTKKSRVVEKLLETGASTPSSDSSLTSSNATESSRTSGETSPTAPAAPTSQPKIQDSSTVDSFRPKRDKLKAGSRQSETPHGGHPCAASTVRAVSSTVDARMMATTVRTGSDSQVQSGVEVVGGVQIIKKAKKKVVHAAPDGAATNSAAAAVVVATATAASPSENPDSATAAALTVPAYLMPPKKATKSKGKVQSSSLSKLDSLRARDQLRSSDLRSGSSSSSKTGDGADVEMTPPPRGHARTESGASEDGDLYIAIRDHVAVDNELMFLKGEQILVIERPSEDLWIGICEGVQGTLLPANVLPFTESLHLVLTGKPENANAGNDLDVDDEDEDGDGDDKKPRHAQLTINDAIEFLDTLGFSRFVDQFEQGSLVDENEIQRLGLLSDLQKDAVLKRVRFLNQLLEDEAKTLQMGSRTSRAEEDQDNEEGSTTENVRRVVTNDSVNIAMLMNTASQATEPADASPRKEPTIRRKQSGRRSKNISELTAEEVQIGQKFALIQFTAMMDRRRAVVPMHVKRNVRNAIGSVLGRWAAERPRDDKAVFGVDLTENVQRCGVRFRGAEGHVPLFCRDVFDYLSREENLRIEGIFRVPGNQARIQDLRERVDRSGGPIDLKNAQIHDVTGLLKLYLKELPDSLFTSDYYKYFASVGQLKEKRQQIQALQMLALFLPEANRSLAALLLNYLNTVSQRSQVNKMDNLNLAVCLAPTLFRDTNVKSVKAATEKDAERQRLTIPVLQLMIECNQLLWKVPIDLQVQIDQAIAGRQQRDKTL